MPKKYYFALLVLFLFFSCTKKSFFSYAEREDILTSIRFLDRNKLGRDSELIDNLNLFGYGSAYYFSYYAEHLRMANLVYKLLSSEIKEDNPFAERAIVRYISLLTSNRLEAHAFINIKIKNLGKKIGASPGIVYACAVLDFYEGNYKAALDKINNINVKDLEIYDLADSYKFVSQIILALNNDDNASINLALDKAFLTGDIVPLKKKGFSSLLKNYSRSKITHASLYQAYSLASDRKFRDAFKTVEYFLNNNRLDFLNETPDAINSLTYIANKAGRRKDMIDILERSVNNFENETKATAYLELGAMYRNRGMPESALINIQKSLKKENGLLSVKNLDRALWYELDLIKKAKNSGKGDSNPFYKTLIASMPNWMDKPYYDDILEDVLVENITARNFADIYYIYSNAVKNHASPAMMSQYGYVLLEAFDAGFDLGTPSKTLRPAFIESSLKDRDSYYYYMVMARAKKTPNFLKSISRGSKDVFNIDYYKHDEELFLDKDILLENDKGYALREVYYQALSLNNKKAVSNDTHMLGFFYYGLHRYNWFFSGFFGSLLKSINDYSTDSLRLVARELSSAEMYLDTIRLMRKVVNKSDYISNIADMKIMYPKAYATELEAAAKKESINPYVLYALVRQESGFTKDIVSRARAVGLAQIMPASGKEFSRNLGMPNYDLTNPRDNLIFGAYYIDWMRRKIDGMYAVLMGYNAGPTRIRRWIRNDWTDLPPALKVESVKFSETRNYVKNITVAAANYAYIYDKIPIHKTVSTIFPDL